MDWGNVTAQDLVDALREVDWSSPPRPVSEFFSRFTVQRSHSKWSSRLKCNLYYYRTNYFIMILFILGIGFLRRPLAIIAAILTGFNIALLNDRVPSVMYFFGLVLFLSAGNSLCGDLPVLRTVVDKSLVLVSPGMTQCLFMRYSIWYDQVSGNQFLYQFTGTPI